MIRPEDIQLRKEQKPQSVNHYSGSFVVETVQGVMAKTKDKINVIGDLSMGKFIDYVSMGRWSMHELVLYVLSYTGPAHVKFCTWSISEESFRVFSKAISQELILSLDCLFDRRIKIRKAAKFQFAKKVCSRVYVQLDCHAKVTLIYNEDWHVVIKSSANMTNNRRIESGVIICDKKVLDFNLSWMESTIKDLNPFSDGI